MTAPALVDLGCSDGRLTAGLAAAVGAAATLGIDSSASMITAAAGHVTDGIRFELGDIGSWEQTGSCQILFANASMQWVPDRAGPQRCRRVSSSSGICLGGRPRRAGSALGTPRPASLSTRRSKNSIWALVLRNSSAAQRASASWTAGSRRRRMLLRSATVEESQPLTGSEIRC
ncbi:MAG: class I SAM-dependent methyltransferase [Acidimicrobiales bacterium]